MNILIEGSDASGKSILAKEVSKAFGMGIQESEGPPRSATDLIERIERYAKMTNTIFVRHPCVSELIYGKYRRGPSLSQQAIDDFYARPPLIIFCEPSRAVHNPKPHDSEEHQELLKAYDEDIRWSYYRWGNKRADLFYRIGHNTGKLIEVIRRLRFDPIKDVADFHTKYQLTYDGKPRLIPEALGDFRLKFMREELDEYASHTDNLATLLRASPDDAEVTTQLEGCLDALVDLVYVALGTSYLHGFDFRAAWARVQTANMAKVRALRAEDSQRGSTYDVVKPTGWTAPCHKDLVEDHAHRQPRQREAYYGETIMTGGGSGS